MTIKDLIPWNNRGREVGFQRAADVHPFFALHREMNRMFDDVFRGFERVQRSLPNYRGYTLDDFDADCLAKEDHDWLDELTARRAYRFLALRFRTSSCCVFQLPDRRTANGGWHPSD